VAVGVLELTSRLIPAFEPRTEDTTELEGSRLPPELPEARKKAFAPIAPARAAIIKGRKRRLTGYLNGNRSNA
jgi:hypothetical protein